MSSIYTIHYTLYHLMCYILYYPICYTLYRVMSPFHTQLLFFITQLAVTLNFTQVPIYLQHLVKKLLSFSKYFKITPRPRSYSVIYIWDIFGIKIKILNQTEVKKYFCNINKSIVYCQNPIILSFLKSQLLCTSQSRPTHQSHSIQQDDKFAFIKIWNGNTITEAT